MSKYLQPESFIDHSDVKTMLAEALKGGYLRIFLGAGASLAFNLPDWDKLVSNIAVKNNIALPHQNSIKNVQWLFENHFSNDQLAFTKSVQTALYQDFDLSIKNLSTSSLMRAIGALSMNGLRGGVSEIVTFNFDDLLELYLKYHGFIVKTTDRQPTLSRHCDVEVLHVHGCLPSNMTLSNPNIVFTELDFDNIINKSSNPWHQRVLQILRSNICIFIGLSGEDANLRTLISQANDNHAVKNSHCYWGIRFSNDEADHRKDMFARKGVYQVTMEHHKLPDWLLDITQVAAGY